MRCVKQQTYLFFFALAVLMIFTPIAAYAGAGAVDLPKTGQTDCYYFDGLDWITDPECDDVAADYANSEWGLQDGYLQEGADWIDTPLAGSSPSGRFTCGANTCLDHLTGLEWLINANCIGDQYAGADPDGVAGDGAVMWLTGRDFIGTMNTGSRADCDGGGYTDWRIPNINELTSLIDFGASDLAQWLEDEGFQNVQRDNYWVSTAYGPYIASGWAIKITPHSNDIADYGITTNGIYVMYENMGQMVGNRGAAAMPVRPLTEYPAGSGNYVCGRTAGGGRTNYVPAPYYNCTFPYIWPVRSGPNDTADPTYPANIPKTGSNTGSWFYRGTDGYVNLGSNPQWPGRWGIPWPTIGNSTSGRFIDNGDETFTDLLAGLVWTKSGNVAYPDTTKTFQGALDYIADMNADINENFGYDDWRLPNILELRSLLYWNVECNGGGGAGGAGSECPVYGGDGTLGIPVGWSYLNWEGFERVTESSTPSGTPAYWSSTTDASDPTRAYTFALFRQAGYLGTDLKVSIYNPGWGPNPSGWYFWPVRTAPPGYFLTVNIMPPGGGIVNSDNTDQPYDLIPAETVNLTAVANTGYSLFDWTGCDAPVGDVCTMTMSSSKTVTANFIPPTVDATVPFGNVNVGLTPTRTLTVYNDSPSMSLDLGTITAPSLPFSITDNCTAASPLAPLGTCDLIVGYSPTSTGQANGSFSIAGVKTIALTGTGMSNIGQDMYVLPSERSFLNTPTNGTSATETIEVRNVGGTDLDIGTIVPPTPPAGVFNFTDLCSGQTLVPYTGPGDECTIDIFYDTTGVGTEVDPFLVNFAIPSGLPNSDPDESSVNVGLFASVTDPANLLPTKPELSSPQNAAMNVNPFRLECAMCNATPTDGDGQDVDYTIYYSTDPSFANSTILGAAESNTGVMYAMAFGNPVFLIALFGILALGVFLKRKKITLIIVAVVFASSLLLIACSNHKDAGDGSGGSGAGAAAARAGQTYYWKIIADDGVGGAKESDTWSFTTQ